MKIGLYFPQLYVVKEDGEPPLRLWALSNLIQDRFEQLPSYQQYLNTLKEKVRRNFTGEIPLPNGFSGQRW